jgi:hypothetical protein
MHRSALTLVASFFAACSAQPKQAPAEEAPAPHETDAAPAPDAPPPEETAAPVDAPPASAAAPAPTAQPTCAELPKKRCQITRGCAWNETKKCIEEGP